MIAIVSPEQNAGWHVMSCAIIAQAAKLCNNYCVPPLVAMAKTLVVHRFWMSSCSEEKSNYCSHQFGPYDGQSRMAYCVQSHIEEQEGECGQLHPEESILYMMRRHSVLHDVVVDRRAMMVPTFIIAGICNKSAQKNGRSADWPTQKVVLRFQDFQARQISFRSVLWMW
jgi:hypothetical protein